MTRLDFNMTGTDELRRTLRRLDGPAQDAALDGIEAWARDIETVAKRGIQGGPKTGETVEKTNPRRTHKQSAAGQFPATDTGRLVSSIATSRVGQSIRVGSGVVYSKFLEFGTRFMAARPWLQPSIDKTRRRGVAGIVERLRREFARRRR